MILLFVAIAFASNSICNNIEWSHKNYPQLQEKIDDHIGRAANLVTISSEADKILSKLISNKSPVILSWLTKRDLTTAKEEVIAKQWRKYYLENFILNAFPSPNHSVNSSVEKLFADINQIAFTKEKKEHFSKIFNKAKKDALNRVRTWPIEDSLQKQIVDRISQIKLYWFHKLKGTRYQNKPLEFLKWGFAYDPLYNEINIGIAALKYPSDHNIYSVFIHEIAHSFDSCRWSAFFKGSNPFSNINDCLRGANSAGAKRRDDEKIDILFLSKKISQDMVDSLKLNPTCNPSFYPPLGTQKDQILEVFADWFSAEVLASHKEQQTPSLRADLCEPYSLNSGSSYLPHQQRLERIYLTNPQLQKISSYKSTWTYCSF